MDLTLTADDRRLLTKFGTCFFERYAKLTLEHLLGAPFGRLVNRDRPDLQMPDRSLGIEVTRAMNESKLEAVRMLNELAADDIIKLPDTVADDIRQSGYAYGVAEIGTVGHKEYEYWRLALPMKRILENKVRKVCNGFYGDFRSYGLYVFTKDEMSRDEIFDALVYVASLQEGSSRTYSKLYISQIHELAVCDTVTMDVECHVITPAQCRLFYREAVK